MSPRDRDAQGRPLNARPRDGLGRPMPRGAAGVARVPDGLILAPDDALNRAERYLAQGQPFHAHEVLEARWKSCPPEERDLWQGLAQLAVGFTHVRRGNANGARTLLIRAAARLAPYASGCPYGVDVPTLVARAARIAASVEADGTGVIEATELTAPLRAAR